MMDKDTYRVVTRGPTAKFALAITTRKKTCSSATPRWE